MLDIFICFNKGRKGSRSSSSSAFCIHYVAPNALAFYDTCSVEHQRDADEIEVIGGLGSHEVPREAAPSVEGAGGELPHDDPSTETETQEEMENEDEYRAEKNVAGIGEGEEKAEEETDDEGEVVDVWFPALPIEEKSAGTVSQRPALSENPHVSRVRQVAQALMAGCG